MAKKKGLPLGTFLKRFSSETQCQEYLASLRWQTGYVCSKCGCHHGYRLSNGRYQCAQCRHQTSVTAGTVLHKTHMPLARWFLAFYFVSQDKRGISAVRLAAMLGTAYKSKQEFHEKAKRSCKIIAGGNTIMITGRLVEVNDQYYELST